MNNIKTAGTLFSLVRVAKGWDPPNLLSTAGSRPNHRNYYGRLSLYRLPLRPVGNSPKSVADNAQVSEFASQQSTLQMNSSKSSCCSGDNQQYDALDSVIGAASSPSTKWGSFLHTLQHNAISLTASILGLALCVIPPSVLPLNQFIKKLGLSVVFLCSGLPLLISTASRIAHLEIDAHTLMCLSAFASLYLGMATEGALLLVLFHVSHSLEDKFTSEAQVSLKNLLDSVPDTATMITVDEDGLPDFGSIQPMLAKDVAVGSSILVKSGEQVPLDGKVIYGSSTLTLQHISGESVPVAVNVGSNVAAGSRNLDGVIILRSTQTVEESTPTKIAKITYEARVNKPVMHRWVEDITAFWSQCVLFVSACTLLVLLLYFRIPLLGPRGALYRSLGLLTGAAPCALILAPLAYVCALANLSRRGILVRAASTLDTLLSCGSVALDKTGTLTTGKLVFKDIHLPKKDPSTNELNSRKEKILNIACLLANLSDHPVSAAILEAATQNDLSANEQSFNISGYKHMSGSGVSGKISERNGNGVSSVSMGSAHFIKSLFANPAAENLKELLKVSEGVGGAQMLFMERSETGEVLESAVFEFEEKIMDNSRDSVKMLQTGSWRNGHPNQSHIKSLTVLTGDSLRSAVSVGESLKIDKVHAELKPEKKYEFIKQTQQSNVKGDSKESKGQQQQQQQRWIMVGDGMNDAPALAQADVGIAISDTEHAFSATAADIVILNGLGISNIPFILKLAQETREIVLQNVAMAFLSMVFTIVPAVKGMFPLWLCVLIHEGTTVLATINSCRLLLTKPTITSTNK